MCIVIKAENDRRGVGQFQVANATFSTSFYVLVFLHEEWFVGYVPFYLQFLPASETPTFNRYSLVALQP